MSRYKRGKMKYAHKLPKYVERKIIAMKSLMLYQELRSVIKLIKSLRLQRATESYGNIRAKIKKIQVKCSEVKERRYNKKKIRGKIIS